ncbi:MAG: thiamine-phosphate kinase [Bacteroidetes bacterium]|nr:thiamine-phosphate kinase [Bacteroidota bacterium]
MSEGHTDISTLGEFGLIDRLTQNNETRHASTILSIGDDAAVIDHFGRQTVISTDMLVEGIHFDLAYTPLKHLGYKAVVVNLSDIYAMNATPTQITVGLAMSNRFSVEAIDELYEGIYAACERYNVDLVGGDTCSAPKGLTISITAIGEVAPGKFVTRSGAQLNDLVCVSGDLGAAYVGLQLLEREKRIFSENPSIQPDLQNNVYTIGRILKPEPRADIINWLEKNEIVPTSMIDVSDGLSSELLHISNKSGVGCVVYEDKIPIHTETKQTALEFNIAPTTCALNGGEDYELLFTVNQSAYEKLVLSEQISIIGYITEANKGVVLTTKSGNNHKLTAQGWTAFS